MDSIKGLLKKFRKCLDETLFRDWVGKGDQRRFKKGRIKEEGIIWKGE